MTVFLAITFCENCTLPSFKEIHNYIHGNLHTKLFIARLCPLTCPQLLLKVYCS